MNPDVSIIIPAYNESTTIGALVQRLKAAYPEL
jgi:glycosyltransferase involved in cell wall biosynthesis